MEAFAELERRVHAALETYSNVHRGSGHKSMVSTHLYEQARDIVLEYLGLKRGKYVVIFCSPRRAVAIKKLLKTEDYKSVSSQDIGLPLGVKAIAVKRKVLPRGAPFQTGGGTTRLVSPDWVIWANAPDRFEAGTPALINVITLAIALQLIRNSGNNIFMNMGAKKFTVSEILYHDELEEYSGRKLLDELRKTLIGGGFIVPTAEGSRSYINLDNAASTPTFMPVWNTVCQTWQQPLHVQREIINEVKSICAGILGAPLTDYDVIFTSNTTEAINITAESLGNEPEKGTEFVVLNTLLEHNSNDLPWRMIPHCSLIRLKVDDEGFVDLKELDTLLSEYNQKSLHETKRIKLVAVSGASNVLGVFNDLSEISRIVHLYGARLLVDAAQMVAHRKVEMERCGIDYLAFSAHKVYAPFGAGVLVARKGLLGFIPAEMEQIQQSGEENAGGIAALGKALVFLQRIGLDLIREEEQVLTIRALRNLSKVKGLRIYGIKNPDSAGFAQKGGVIVFSLEKIYSNVVARKLAEQGGIGIRYGCHCSHILIKHLVDVGPFLAQFQRVMATLLPAIKFPGLARISLGIENTESDIDTLIRALNKIAAQPETPVKTNVKQQINDFVKAAAERVYNQPDYLKG